MFRGQQIRLIVCLFVTVMCCVQLISILQTSTKYSEFFYPMSQSQFSHSPVGNRNDVAQKLTKSEKPTSSNRKGQNDLSGDLISLLSRRKQTLTMSMKQSKKPYKLKPGKALNQAKKQLSNGHNVGWIPAYNRTAYRLLHASPACKEDDVYVAVVVSAGKNTERRKAIRKTWGSQLKTVFVLGANATKNAELEVEARTYKDIVQADFREGYYNLTYNTITAFRWVTIYCPAAEYIIKGDDDTWFNIDLLKTEVAIAADGPMIMGKLFTGAYRNKNPKSKWYTPSEAVSQNVYPNFVSGAGYVVTRAAIPLLYNKLLMEHLILNLEDLFVTGFIAEELGVRRKSIHDFFNHRFTQLPVNGCTYARALQSHEITPKEMLKIWSDIRNPVLKC